MNSDQLRRDLLDELKVVEKRVRADLLAQYRANPALMARAMLRLREEENSPADRVAWLETFAGRGAVLYILKTLYVRVLEDQGLLRPIRIRDGGTYALFRSLFPQLGHAAYLRRVFDDAERALPELFAPTPVEIATPSGEAASLVWNVWQLAAPGGGPRFDFRGSDLDTRFIGDLYQDLDPDVKARYALLQTPRFIEEFILDRTLDPALGEFGLHDFRIIDPTCGSGHFLLGAFERLARAWQVKLGEVPDARWLAAESALTAVYGADLNEYACALSRFRLLLAIVKETGVTDLDRLRTLHMNVIACDSLIPWERLATEMLPGTAEPWLAGYGTPEERSRNEDFFARDFHAVVGNPPYIAVKDKKKSEDYRLAWPRSASGKYSLSAPMTERFLLLPMRGGRAGIIVANNFCKRSFGKGIVEKVLRDVRLDSVVDTGGAFIPGHGTPTVMLFSARSAPDLAHHEAIVVAGKRGEPREPIDAARGIVWSSIVEHAAEIGFEDAWIAVQRVPQTTLLKHPWSLGSDAVMGIKSRLDAFPRLQYLGAEAGFATSIKESGCFQRRFARQLPLKPMLDGSNIRDWQTVGIPETVLCPYNSAGDDFLPDIEPRASAELWSLRTTLKNRGIYGSTFEASGFKWWQYFHYKGVWLKEGQPRIEYALISTNSHFRYSYQEDHLVSDTAQLLILRAPDNAQYQQVAAILNSSTLEFWFKQVCFKKMDGGKAVKNEEWQKDYVRNGTNVLQAPMPDNVESGLSLFDLEGITSRLEDTFRELSLCAPKQILIAAGSLSSNLYVAEHKMETLLERLVGLQEELDWRIYEAFGLLKHAPKSDLNGTFALARGHRPFEIILGRRMANGDEKSVWFERHGLKSCTEIPERYIGYQRQVLRERLDLVENNPTIALLEQPMYKRRWIFEPWGALVADAAQTWLLDALETIVHNATSTLTASDIVNRLAADTKSAAIAAHATTSRDTSLADTVARLLSNESIPDNPARLLTPTGLAKLIGSQTADLGDSGAAPHAKPFEPGGAVNWKHVWRLQEREDATLGVSDAVPPPFVRTDYAHPNGWRIRGKFNIANERFIVYDELAPKRYAWGGRTIPERARLSAEVFDLRGRQVEADNSPPASVQPTRDSPLRCGIQFPLWDKLDELRRVADPNYADVRELAMLCGRTCPCDVLDAWRERAMPARGKRPAAAKPAVRTTPTDEAKAPELDAALLDRLFEAIRRGGGSGITAALLEPTTGGDRELLRRALDALRTDGRIEPHGRGRGTRYRPAENRLL